MDKDQKECIEASAVYDCFATGRRMRPMCCHGRASKGQLLRHEVEGPGKKMDCLNYALGRDLLSRLFHQAACLP